MSVSVGCDDLKDTVVDGEVGDIKGSATKIEHKDVLLAFLLVHTISDGGGSGLVDDPHHVQASDGSSILGGLPLSVVEVGRHGDDCVGNLLAKERLSGLLHLGQHHSRDLLSCKGLLALAGLDLDVRLGVLLNKLEGEELDVSLDGLVGELTSDETLGVENCILGVGGQLVLGGVTDQPLAVGSEGNVAGGDPVTLVIGNDLHSSVLEHTHTGVSGSKINSDDSSEVGLLLVLLLVRSDEDGQADQAEHQIPLHHASSLPKTLL